MNSLNFQIKQEATDADITDECNNETISDTIDCNSKKESNGKEEIREIKMLQLKKEEDIYVTEVDVSYEKYPIKSEPGHIEEQEIKDSSYVFTYKAEANDIKIEIKPEVEESCEEKFEKTIKEEYISDEVMSLDNESNNIKQSSKSTKASATVVHVKRPRKKTPKSRAQRNKEYRERLKIKKQNEPLNPSTKASTPAAKVIRPGKRPPKSRAQINKEYRERQKIKKKNDPPSTTFKSRAEYMKEYRHRVKLKNQRIQLNALLAKYNIEKQKRNEIKSEETDTLSDIQASTVDDKLRFTFEMESSAVPLPNKTIKDEAEDQAESTFSPTYNISEVTVKMEHNNDFTNAAVDKSLNNEERIELNKNKVEINIDCDGEEPNDAEVHKEEEVTNNSHKNEIKSHLQENLNRKSNAKHTKSFVFHCSECRYITFRKVELNRHIKSQHTESTVFDCPYCSYRAYRKSNLDLHINCQHTKVTAYNCPYCSYKAYHKTHLNRHINSQHTKSTVYNCPYCSYKAYQKNHLDRHINSQHTKSTVFDCAYCSFKTYHKGNLGKHVNSKHTKSVVFSCSYCDFVTCLRGNLSKHIKRKHS